MLDFFNKNKVAIGLGIVAVLGLWYYFTNFTGGSAPLTAAPADETSISGSLLVTLNSLHTLRLDEAIFKDPAFVSLSDFGVAIPPQDAGRRNPFAPVGQGSAPPASTQ